MIFDKLLLPLREFYTLVGRCRLNIGFLLSLKLQIPFDLGFLFSVISVLLSCSCFSNPCSQSDAFICIFFRNPLPIIEVIGMICKIVNPKVVE